MQVIGSKDLLHSIGYKPFKQRFPWIGKDLQTIKSTITKHTLKKSFGVFSRHSFPCDAGVLHGALNIPQDQKPKALVLLCPGLGGCEDTITIIEFAAAMVEEGFATLRINYRGNGASAASSTAPFHAGLTEDIYAVVKNLPPEIADLPVFLFGYSLGGHLVLRSLTEETLPQNVIGAVSIAAPLCLSSTVTTLEKKRNIVYERYLLWHLRRDLQPAYGDKAMAIKSVREIDDTITAPAFGFKNAEDYYQQTSVLPHLNKIKTPNLVIQAMDDPWVLASTYAEANWARHPKSATILSPYGGHMGFHGVGDKRTWALDLTLNYLEHLYATR